MPSVGTPKILAVDDEPDELRHELELGLDGKANYEVLHPRDVQITHLEEADLVLVDYRLEHWPERDAVGLALQPASGLALAVLLREHVDNAKLGTLTAFALHTGHLGDIKGRLPANSSEHIIARLNNLEWAFSKASEKRWQQIVILAEAVRQMPRKWPEDDFVRSENMARKLLALSEDTDWFDRAWRDVYKCQPPIHHLSDGAHGMLFVRWLLHEILPYPTFLWKEEWVAARLRLSTTCLNGIIHEKEGQLAKDLGILSYKGAVQGFLGNRWWRAGLEQFVWEITDGRSSNLESLHAALRERTRVPLDSLPSDASLVCMSAELVPTGEIITPEEGVRIRPDQWPPFAEDAWTSVALAKEYLELKAIVDPIDSARLEKIQGESR